MDNQMKQHWNNIYLSSEVSTLGWYEKEPTPCLRLLAKCKVGKDDPILDIGGGASTFIDSLLDENTPILSLQI